jgi:mono/diheme cytochrome c family protein
MFTRVIIALVALVVAFAILGADTGPEIRKVSPSPTSPVSGKQMFATYCAVCHGADANGSGPAAMALKTPPADLTQLSANNGGRFPELKVAGAILGDTDRPAAHGSQQTPVWGPVFRSLSRDNGADTQMRVANLTAYIKTLQAK